jgi:RNA polymerase sigma-70 factor (ECF subfamily)
MQKKNELYKKVEGLIRLLPEEQRTAYILCEIDSKNYDEISIITSVPVGTVRSRIFRARKFLLDGLKEQI